MILLSDNMPGCVPDDQTDRSVPGAKIVKEENKDDVIMPMNCA